MATKQTQKLIACCGAEFQLEGVPAVSVQGMADVAEVGAYLMHAAGDGCDEKKGVADAAAAAAVAIALSTFLSRHSIPYQCILLHHSQPFELGDRLFSSRMRRRKMPCDGRNRLQSNVNTAMSRCHPAAQSDVRLAHAMALEFCGQS